MDGRQTRLARNESLFRSTDAPDGQFEFSCECPDAECDQVLAMSASEYEGIRRNPVLFIVAPGHEVPDLETVVLRRDAYQIVTKRP